MLSFLYLFFVTAFVSVLSKEYDWGDAITFETLEEYDLFLSSNDLNSDNNPDNPAYLVKCIEANKNKASACLDGSPQAFYFRPGYDDGLTKYLIYLQGGGWCSGVDNDVAPSCSGSCASRASGSLGTSVTDLPYMYFAETGDGYMSNQYVDNPLAYNWNTIYVRYCDGASFSGNNMTDTHSSNGTQIYFRGFNNLKAVLDLLKTQHGLDKATDVILTGSSAGGLATWLHTDFVADYVGPNVNFLSMPDSGFFMDYEGDGMYDSCMHWIYDYQNTSIALNDECMNAKNVDNYKCMFAQYTAPFIKSKILALQSRFDSWQTGQELRSTNATLINEYGNNLTNVIMDVFINNGQYNSNHSVFLDSCAHHTDHWNDIVIDGFNSSSAEVDLWYSNNTHSKVYFQNMTYPCTSCCTP